MAIVAVFGFCAIPFGGRATATANIHLHQKAANEQTANGTELPGFIVDFVGINHGGHCGCPVVMISNSRGRGLIIISRDLNAASVQLAMALDAGGSSENLRTFLISPDPISVAEFKDKQNFSRVIIGVPRSSAGLFERLSVEDNWETVVYFLDGKTVNSTRAFKGGELNDEAIAEVVDLAMEFSQTKSDAETSTCLATVPVNSNANESSRVDQAVSS